MYNIVPTFLLDSYLFFKSLTKLLSGVTLAQFSLYLSPVFCFILLLLCVFFLHYVVTFRNTRCIIAELTAQCWEGKDMEL